MRFLHFLPVVVLLTAFGANECAAQKNKNRKPTRKPPVNKPAPPVNNELKVLYEDNQSGVEDPFVFVARDAASLAELQKIAGKFSVAGSIDFDKNAVVAAFAGTKPTPGYGITFQRTPGRIKIDLTAPPKDAILAQVLTSPAKVVLVPVEKDQSLQIETGKDWQVKSQTFRITGGNFTYSGGFAGKKQSFPLTGTIHLLRSGDFVTAFFRLDAKQGNMIRQTTDTATGKVENGAISLWRVDPGNLVELPRPSLKATGKLIDKNLTLAFESLPTTVADGFSGEGNLMAVLSK